MRIFSPWRNTLLYSSQVQYRNSNYCFQTHQQIWSLLQCSLSINVEAYCQKQQTYCLRLYFLDFAIANFFMILVVSISYRTSCFVVFFRIRLFSLFCLMALFKCSFYHLKVYKMTVLNCSWSPWELNKWANHL